MRFSRSHQRLPPGAHQSAERLLLDQVDASNNSQVGSFDPFGGNIKAPGAPLPNNLGTRTAGSGPGFNPLWLLLAIPFVFPNQFKKLTKIKY